jgi:hypothetical protein
MENNSYKKTHQENNSATHKSRIARMLCFLVLFCLSAAFAPSAFAQKAVTGRVIDSNGEPLSV